MLDSVVRNLLPFERENKLLVFTENDVYEETGLRSLLELKWALAHFNNYSHIR